jgi:hypothetical protein
VKAYEPKLLGIGPYHHGKDDLKRMEDHKLLYSQQLLHRRNESSVERYTRAMRDLEGKARRCYAEPISLTPDEFVEMMLLDGCFIIELFRKQARKELRDDHDPIFQLGWMLPMLWCDLVLFENQLPSFVLYELIEMTGVSNQQDNFISDFTRFSLCYISPKGGQTESTVRSDSTVELHQNTEHLLALVHKSLTPPDNQNDRDGNVQWNPIPSATELQEAGVKFKKLEGVNLHDIKFNNGVMEIPLLKIVDTTESIFRNLIAYEQYNQSNHHNYVTEYVSVMDYLINSPKDVELLRRRGIIENCLGDDEAVSTIFNKLLEFVKVSNLCHAKIFRDVDKHCRRHRNVWMANLRHNYFHSPWALISVLAAAFLLMLALTQTIFSVLSYIVSKK